MDDRNAYVLWTRPQMGEVEAFSAAELKHYLAQMLKRDIDSRSAPHPVDRPTLYLRIEPTGSPVDLPLLVHDLPADGYVLQSIKDGVLLQSPTPRGLLYAVYGLLKRLGARWFFPGPEGEFVPQLEGLVLDGIAVTTSPAIEQRGVLIRGTNSILDQWVDFAPKIGLNAFALETHRGIHRLPGLAKGRGLHLRLRRHFFPTLFCSQDERTLGWEEALMRGYLQSLPEGIDSVHLRPADAFSARCTCPTDEPFSLVDQVMRFTNRMARTMRTVRPEEEFPYVSYLSTWAPPPEVKPGPGVNLSLAPIHRCFNHALNDPACWINSSYRYDKPMAGIVEYGPRPIIEEHLQHFDPANTFVVDYWVDSSYFGRFQMIHWEGRIPNNGRVLQQDLQYYHGLGIPSIWTFVVFIDKDYLQRFVSPLIFQYGELLWNPDADLGAGLHDFCQHYYGNEALHEVFDLDEYSDPRDLTSEDWRRQMERKSKALRTTREAAAAEGDEVLRNRIERLIAEQEHCIAAMEKYLQEAPSP
jgi:hypothetical protein